MSQMTSNWANVGDLVFVLDRNNKPVPCKIIRIIGDGKSKSTQFFFETIVDEDKPRIPRNRLKCFMNQVGYAGGFVFQKKENALDYLRLREEGKNPTVTNMISRKISKKTNQKVSTLEMIKQEVEQHTVNHVQKTLTAAMLITLKKEFNFGPKRASAVIDGINAILEEIGRGEKTKEDVVKEAEQLMKIRI